MITFRVASSYRISQACRKFAAGTNLPH